MSSGACSVVDLNNCHEGFLGHVDFAHRLHSLLALSLLGQQLLLSRDVSSVALSQDVFQQCRNVSGGNWLGSDTGLNWDLLGLLREGVWAM